MNMEKAKTGKKRKGLLIAGIIVLAVTLLNGYLFLNAYNQMKWSPVKRFEREDRERLAGYVMMPGIGDSLEKASSRGLRDAEYKIETKSFGTLEELYAILPFKDEAAMKEAIAELEKNEAEPPEKLGLKDYIKVYRADILPVTDTDKDGSKSAAYYYTHEYYVVQDNSGYRFVFFVGTN